MTNRLLAQRSPLTDHEWWISKPSAESPLPLHWTYLTSGGAEYLIRVAPARTATGDPDGYVAHIDRADRQAPDLSWSIHADTLEDAKRLAVEEVIEQDPAWWLTGNDACTWTAPRGALA